MMKTKTSREIELEGLLKRAVELIEDELYDEEAWGDLYKSEKLIAFQCLIRSTIEGNNINRGQ